MLRNFYPRPDFTDRDFRDLSELIALMQRDSSACYDFSVSELRAVMAEMGETETLVDALLMAEDQSIEARADALGVRVSDFRY